MTHPPLSQTYTGTLTRFVITDDNGHLLAEAAEFTNGQVVESRTAKDGTELRTRYATLNTLRAEWEGRGTIRLQPPAADPQPRRFVFRRHVDTTGVSGTGIAVEGVQFTHGGVQLRWLSEPSSLVEWDTVEDAIYIHSHRGTPHTTLQWLDTTQ